VIEVPRPNDEPTHLVGTQHGRESSVAFRRREIVFERPAFEDADKEETERRDVEPYGPDRELLLSNR
jgi:hypothetical protein